MNWWWIEKQKVLKDSSPLIDGLLLLTPDADELLFETILPRSRRESREGKHEIWNGNMENELLKKGTFGNVMLGSWMESNTQNPLSQDFCYEELIEKPSASINYLSIRQVPLDQLCFVEWRNPIILCYERTSIYLKTFQDQIQIISNQDFSQEESFNNYESKQSQVKCDYRYDFRQIWGWSIYSIKTLSTTRR